MKTYLINLDKSIDRLKIMKRRTEDIGISFERVVGINGADLCNSSVIMNAPNEMFPHFLAPGEIGCFLSHRKCWENLVHSDADWALILEDDCIFHPMAAQYLTSANWIPESCQLIQFVYRHGIKTYSDKQIQLSDGNFLLRSVASAPVGAYAYFISKDAARIALEKSQTISEPVDNFLFGMFSPFSHHVDCWRPQGVVVEQCLKIPTTIPGRRKQPFSWYKFHPWRLWKKLHLKYLRLTLKSLGHYILF